MGLIPFPLEDAEDDGGASLREFYAMNTNLEGKSAIWVSTRREDRKIFRRDGSPYLDEDGEPLTVGVYHIQGVFTEEKLAVTACRDPSYMVGSLPLNLSLPHAPVEWSGAYFPLRREPPQLPPASAAGEPEAEAEQV